jgi:hypothetical protein
MGKTVYETGCSAKMYLAGEEAAEAGVVDIARTQADSCLMSSGPPAREREEAGQTGEDIDRKPLQAYHTVGSSLQHWDRWGRSVAAEGARHTGHKELRHSVAEADIERSVADNAHIDVAEAGVGGAEAEATMMGTAYDMVVVAVDASDDASDAPTGVGAQRSGEGVDVEAGGELAGERDAGAGAVARTDGAVAAGPEDSQGQTVVAEGRWPWNVDGDRKSWTGPQAPERDRFPTPQYSEAG